MLSVFWGTGYLTQNKKSLVHNRESLDMMCAPSVGEEQVSEFETLFTAVRYICSDAHLKKEYLWHISSTTDSYTIVLVKSMIIILRCIHIHTWKHQLDAEQGKK